MERVEGGAERGGRGEGVRFRFGSTCSLCSFYFSPPFFWTEFVTTPSSGLNIVQQW